MATTYELYQQRRQQVLGTGGKNPSPTSGGSPYDSFQQRRKQILTAKPTVTQPKPQAKKIAPKEENKGFFQDLFAGLTWDRVKENVKQDVERLKGSVKTGLGVLRQQNQAKGGYNLDKLQVKDGKISLDPTKVEKAKQADAKLVQEGREQQNKANQKIQELGQAKGKGAQIVEMIAGSSASTASSIGISAATLLVTKNPALAATLGFSGNYAQTKGQIYNEAKNYGVSDKKAMEASDVGAAAIGIIDTLPLGRLLDRTGAGKLVKQSIIKEVTKSAVLQGGEEAGTEYIQQVIQNAVAKVAYDPNRQLLDGAAEAGLAGFVVGGVTGAGFDVGTALQTPNEKVIQTANQKIKEAIDTPLEKRTPEQQKIVSTLLTNQVTPEQAISLVNNTNMKNTSDGKDIIRSAIQARRDNKVLEFRQDEKTGEMEVTIADRKTPEQIQQEIETESKRVELRKAVRLKDQYESDLERVTTQRVYDDPEKYKNEYVKRFGNEINTDLARELFTEDGYNEANSPQVQNAATAVRDMVFDEIINTKQGQGNNTILVTAGGSGSGKSTALDIVIPEKQNYPGIFDTTLANKSMEKKIDAILEKGFDVQIAFVMRDIVDAWENGVLKRKRTVGENYHIDAHMQSRERVLALMEKYKDDDRVEIGVIDNTKGKENISVVENPIDFLKSFNYNTADVRKKIQDATERAKQSAKISEEQYKGFTNDRENNVPATSRQSQEKPSEGRQQEKQQVASDTPQGTGKIKESRLFKRVKEVLGAEFESQKVTYNELSLEKQAEAVTQLIQDDPKRAARIARGLEEVPQGMTQNAVALGLFSTAAGKGDFQLAADLLTQTTLRSTRLGQEIVSLRGAFNGDTPENAVRRVVQSRLDQIADNYKSEINNLEIEKSAPKAKKATKLIEKQAKELKKQLTDAQKSRIKSAQEVIDLLKCK